MCQISIILPCYNAEATLYDTLLSINNQNFNSDYELIFINDGSCDKSIDIFKKFVFKKNIHIVLINRENKGFLYSLDEGINKSKGIIIARIDADDIWLENHLSLCYNAIMSNEKICLVGTNAIIVNADNKEIERTNVVCDYSKIIRFMHNDNPFIHSSVLFRKSAYMQTSKYYIGNSEQANHISDYYLWFQMSKIGICINIKDVSLKYKLLYNSMSRKINRKDNYIARYKVMKKVNEFYHIYPIYSLICRIKIILKIFLLSLKIH